MRVTRKRIAGFKEALAQLEGRAVAYQLELANQGLPGEAAAARICYCLEDALEAAHELLEQLPNP